MIQQQRHPAADLAFKPALTLGIVGYSTRALAQAVIDVGFSAISVDAFADQDTLDCCQQCYVVPRWPDDVLDACRHAKVDAWLLTGGMEHDCLLIEQLSQLAPVLGPSPEELEQLRSRQFWRMCVEDCNNDSADSHQPSAIIGWPETHDQLPRGWQSSTARDTEYWLFKPTKSSGGLGIRRSHHPTSGATSGSISGSISGAIPHDDAAQAAGYWQRFIKGRSLGVTWIIGTERATCLGVTESLQSEHWPGPLPFIYRGSIGPVPLTAQQNDGLSRLIDNVRRRLPEMRGWLQADFIEDEQGRLWLLEFNPRWTASMELLHQCRPSRRLSPAWQHLSQWGLLQGAASTVCQPAESNVDFETDCFLAAKAILYAGHEVQLDQAQRMALNKQRNWQKLPIPCGLPIPIGLTEDRQFSGQDRNSENQNPGSLVEWSLADVPAVGNSEFLRLPVGSPVLTLRTRIVRKRFSCES